MRRNVIDVSYHISQYQQIIQELAQEIALLKDQRSDLESRISYLDPKQNGNNANYNLENNGSSKLKTEETLKLRESLLQSFKEQIKLRKNILELDNALMDINLEADRNRKILENNEGASGLGASELHKNARDELKVIEMERDELEASRKTTIKDLENLKVNLYIL
jgi:kinesin family protein 18/19